jgi:UDPglucose 6-dehydrogenase
MRVAIIGSGYVGLVAAACLAEIGHEVICADQDEKRIAALRQGEVPIHEEYLPELLAQHRNKRLSFTTSLPQAVRSASAIFIAVGTPMAESGEADLCAVEAVAQELAGCIRGYKVIVEKSTVPVCTNERVGQVLRWNGAPHECFDVVSNPEFLREGTAVTDFLYPDRIVIGSNSAKALAVMREIYRPLTNGSYLLRPDRIPSPEKATLPAQMIETSAKSAELIKHASNAFLAMKISFINAVANLCENVGADIEEVCRGMGSDSRIGSKFLHPGIGYGGSCFPKDLLAFRAVGRENGVDLRLLSEVVSINHEQRERFVRKLRRVLWVLRGKRVAVLGLAFKGGTDDLRESPAIEIVRCLLAEGCRVTVHDPAAMEHARQLLAREPLVFARDAYHAADDADAMLVLTDWKEFIELDLKRIRQLMKYPLVMDGRNLYSPEYMRKLGFYYVSVGRPDVVPTLSTPRSVDARELRKEPLPPELPRAG